jgi:hypothetical protein
VNGTVQENVAWRCAALCVKGDKHVIKSNTVFDSSDERVTAALFPMMFDKSKPWSIPGENAHTKLSQNAADSIFNVSGVLPGIHTGNIAGTPVRPLLVDASALNFRPLPGSVLDKAQAGAYSSSPSVAYWVPGRRGGGGGGMSGVTCHDAQCEYWKATRASIRN